MIPAALAGWLLVLLMTFQFSEETRVVIDRHAGTIVVDGRRWFREPWHVDRPLDDVARIDVRSLYAGRGQRRYMIYAVFKDETEALLWTPAAVFLSMLEQRVAEMRSV